MRENINTVCAGRSLEASTDQTFTEVSGADAGSTIPYPSASSGHVHIVRGEVAGLPGQLSGSKDCSGERHPDAYATDPLSGQKVFPDRCTDDIISVADNRDEPNTDCDGVAAWFPSEELWTQPERIRKRETPLTGSGFRSS